MTTNTAAMAMALRGQERAMTLDLLDEAPITRIFEDENPVFLGGDESNGFVTDEDFAWAMSIHNEG